MAYSAERWDRGAVHPREGGIVALTLACLQENKPELKLEPLEGSKVLRLGTPVLTRIA